MLFTDLSFLDSSSEHLTFVMPVGYYPSDEPGHNGETRYHYLFFLADGSQEPQLVSYERPYFDSTSAYARLMKALAEASSDEQ